MRPYIAALLGALVLLLAPAAAAPAQARTPVQLGAAINDDGFQAPDPRYRATLARYDAVVAESAFKIAETEPQPGVFTFGLQDQMVSWALGAGQQVHGHTLLWCRDAWLPSWLLDRAWTADELTSVLDDYITTVMRHFGTAVGSWDVVNEAFNDDGTPYDCLWSRVLGPGWVEHAFRVAHAAVPSAQLFYDEYRADWVNTKFTAMEAMARDFLARGVPLDGIGLQMHLYGRAPPQYRIEEAMARVAALGLQVQITELDDSTSSLPGTTAQKLDQQAQAYQTVAAACQAQPACGRLTTWGFTDAYYRGAGAMALPFDTEYQPKPAWFALQRVLRTPVPAPGNRAPGAPDAPSASAAVSRGQFTVSWPAAVDPDGDALTYALQHRDANDGDWSTIASGIRGLSYAFSSTWPEPQGTWTYRVVGSDAATDGPPSAASAPAVVDRTAPLAPLVTADRAADALGGDWFADAVTLGFASAGDPPLPDGSPGSGVAPASLPAGGSFATAGPHVLSGTVSDLAGNVSDPGTRTVQVDAAAPVATLGATAGGRAYAPGTWTNQPVTLHLACADEGSGVASVDPDQVVEGDGAGQRRTATCRDRVGHSAVAAFGPIDVDRTAPTAPAQTVAAVAGEPVTLRAGASDPPGGSGLAPDGFAWSRPGTPVRRGPSVRFTFPTPGTRSLLLRFRDVAGNAGAAAVTVVVGPARSTTLRSGAVTATLPRRVTGRAIILRVRSDATRTVRVRLERRGARRPLATLHATVAARHARTLRVRLPSGAHAGTYVVRLSVLRGRRPVGHVVSANVVVGGL